MEPTLSKKHLIPFEIWYQEFAPNYPVIRVQNAHASASIALHGAHIIDFIPNDQEPVIFTSNQAHFREGTAIRGGIPICWPWFHAHPNDSSMPSHGFARNRFWELIGSHTSQEHTELVLELNTNTIDSWKFETKVTLTIKIGKSLGLELKTTNNGNSHVTIGGALHSYFYISDVRDISLSGLDGIDFLDTLTSEKKVQEGAIRIDSEIDNIYLNTPHTLQIHDPTFKRVIHIEKSGSQSTVIWNPWIDKSTQLRDLGDDEFYNFVCVETANALEDTYSLAPLSEHILSTTIRSISV